MLRLCQYEGVYSVFVTIDISRDLARTGFEHAHLKRNWRARVLVTIIGSLINVLSY